MTLRLLDACRRPLAWADAALNRLYGWRHNPLYHSGVLAAALLAVVLITGVYLLLFYRISAPYASVARITDEVPLGSFTRSFHRYASDAAIVAVVVHAGRMWLQRRTWGSRAMAWYSGLVLLMLVWVLGWTGYVMVWDVAGEVLAREGARWMDALPFFSEPISRTFDGTRPPPNAFFFLNLFAHVALPIGVALALWIHVARLARPKLVPPRGLLVATAVLLMLASALVPVPVGPPADLLRSADRAEYDVFYAFFLPFTRPWAPWVVWAAGGASTAVLMALPLLMRPRPERRPVPSVVDERSCTGCEQCYVDCPYEAIAMVARADGRPTLVSRVDPDLCTSCGICAGSCAPMGIGPPGRTGKDQLRAARALVPAHAPAAGDVVVIACSRSAVGRRRQLDGAPVLAVSCAGNLHTSVVELFARSGLGVLVVSCPPRDCWNREGPIWLEQRLFHDREAELAPRVDRRRVRLAFAAEAETAVAERALVALRADLATLGTEDAAPADAAELERECDAPVTVPQRAS